MIKSIKTNVSIIIITTIPSKRFSNHFKTITIRDSIVAGLTRYQGIWTKYLQPLRTLNCGIGVQNALWRAQNLPVISIIKNVVILCETNKLFQDSPEDIVDAIIEILQTFQPDYISINFATDGILPCDASCSINRVLIKEVNKILNAKCSK